MLIKKKNVVYCAAPNFKNNRKILTKLRLMGAKPISIELNRQGLNPIQDLISWILISIKIYKIKPDLVIPYTVKPVIYSGFAIRFLNQFNRSKIKFYPLITGLGFAFTKREGTTLHKIFSLIIKIMLKESLKVSDTIIFQNPDDIHFFKENKFISEKIKTARVFGSGVNLETYPAKEIPKSKNFLMVARLNEDKGVREYLAAANLIKKIYPKIIFELAGGFDDHPYSLKKDELQFYLSKGIIKYLGELGSINDALERSTFFVLPSYREGTPRSVLEAMATARPIITTDVPGCRETVINGHNGFLVKHKDTDSLYRAMLKILNCSDDEIKLMGDNSLNIAKKKFDVHKVNKTLLSIFLD